MPEKTAEILLLSPCIDRFFLEENLEDKKQTVLSHRRWNDIHSYLMDFVVPDNILDLRTRIAFPHFHGITRIVK
jgi:hypothetical protein